MGLVTIIKRDEALCCQLLPSQPQQKRRQPLLSHSYSNGGRNGSVTKQAGKKTSSLLTEQKKETNINDEHSPIKDQAMIQALHQAMVQSEAS